MVARLFSALQHSKYIIKGGRGTEAPSCLNNLCLSLHDLSSSNNVDALGQRRQ